jgi:murein DD-endopeptidase MepM/ murein hydrolase activator NlpD
MKIIGIISVLVSSCATQIPAPIEFAANNSSKVQRVDSEEFVVPVEEKIVSKPLKVEVIEKPKIVEKQKSVEKPKLLEKPKIIEEKILPKAKVKKEEIDLEVIESVITESQPKKEAIVKQGDKPKDIEEPLAKKAYIMPVNGEIIGKFGEEDGISIKANKGAKVVSSCDSEVMHIGDDPKFGKLILTKAKDNIYLAYAHLDSILIKKGDKIKQGDIIGNVGQTGEATEPQLYFAMRKGSDPVDPLTFLK